VIDDTKGRTLLAISTQTPELKASLKKGGGNLAAAELVGKAIAERSLKAGIRQVVFDRGGYRYHGRVMVLADAARKGGLSF
jgi:large subunit ribosomal protein L18